MSYLLRRLGFYAIAAWVSVTINFFLPRLMPGDPASTIFARYQGKLQPDQLDAMKKAYGLSNDPLPKQYVTNIWNLLHGNLGISILHFPTPVTDVIGQSLSWTFLLGGTALFLSFLLGSFFGIIGAWKRGGALDSIMPPVFIFAGAFPYFWLATLALYFLGFVHPIFPLRHAYSDSLSPGWNLTFAWSIGTHLFLPAATVVFVSIGGWMLSMRNTMLSTLSEDYITMAEAKGLRSRRIMFNYAARNALLPNVTALGMAVGFVLSGALLTEVVFSYPGLGYQLINAVQNLDYPLMQGLFLMITFAVLIANLIVDIVYVRLDPRVRAS